jgi:WD40 repeat protein
MSAADDETVRLWEKSSGNLSLIFHAAGHIKTAGFHPDGRTLAAGDGVGRLYFLSLENFCIGPPIFTPWYSPIDQTYAFGCTNCRNWSQIPVSALGTQIPCPKCGQAVKLNPFTIIADWRLIDKAWNPKT